MPDDVVLLNRSDNGLLLRDGTGQRLFAVNILLSVCRRSGYERVPVIGHRDHDGVNIVARQHFAIIVIGFAIFVSIFGVDGVHRSLQMIFV